MESILPKPTTPPDYNGKALRLSDMMSEIRWTMLICLAVSVGIDIYNGMAGRTQFIPNELVKDTFKTLLGVYIGLINPDLIRNQFKSVINKIGGNENGS